MSWARYLERIVVLNPAKHRDKVMAGTLRTSCPFIIYGKNEDSSFLTGVTRQKYRLIWCYTDKPTQYTIIREFLQIGISSRYIACDIAEIVHAGYTNRTAISVLQKKHNVCNTKNLRKIKQLIEKFSSPIKISFFLGKKNDQGFLWFS